MISSRHQLWAAVLFWLLFLVWTWKLLEPQPVPERMMRGLSSFWELLPFLLAKSLHAFGYATLALLLWLWTPARFRWYAIAMLLLHGVATEIAQTYIPNRTGKWADVLIDWAGIAIGVWLVRRWVERFNRRELRQEHLH